MLAEASRGWKQLLKYLGELVVLLKHDLEKTFYILNPGFKVEDIMEENVFDVMEGTLESMSKIEEYRMEMKPNQVQNAKVMKEVE